MDTGTDTESITVTFTVKNADKKRLSCGDRSSLTPGRARKRNADVVDEDPLFATKRQRTTQAIEVEQRRVRSNDPVEGGVAYTIPVLVVTKKQNNVPETAIQLHKEGPDEDMDLDEDKENTAASLDITAQGTAKDVDVYGSTSNPIIIDVYGSDSNLITVDNILTTESTTDTNIPKRETSVLIVLGKNTSLCLFRTFGLGTHGWLPLP